MNDLIERLRAMGASQRPHIGDEAADEIERLLISCKHFEKDIKRLKEINYELQFGLGLRDEQIAKLQAVVDAAKAYFWASNLSQYDADSLDIQGNFEKALAALEDDDD